MAHRFEPQSLFRRGPIVAALTLHAVVIAFVCAYPGQGSGPQTRVIQVGIEFDAAEVLAQLVADAEPIQAEPVPEPLPLADAPFVEQFIDPPPKDAPPPPEEPEVVEASFDLDRQPVDEEIPWLLRVRPRRTLPSTTPACRPVAPAPVVVHASPTPLTELNSPPGYPARAIRMGLQGTVLLSVEVDAMGWVASCAVQVSSGSSLLDSAAVRAVRKWRFDGGPGAVTLPVQFSLRRPR